MFNSLLFRSLALSALAAVIGFPAHPAPGAGMPATLDWPAFHQNLARTGAPGDGQTPVQPHLRWKFRDPEERAAIMSSPAVVGGRLFVGADSGTLYCLDAGTGQPIWRATTDWEVVSSPAV